MQKSIICAATVALLAMCVNGTAAMLIPIVPVAGSNGATGIRGVNNNNIITGEWYDAHGVEHGYFGTLAGSYTTFDYTGNTAAGTEPRNINDSNLIVGWAPTDGTGNYFRGPQFEYDGATGTMTTIKKGKTPVDGILSGLNRAGEFAGERFVLQNGALQRLGYLGKRAKWVQDLPLVFGTTARARGINRAGVVVGFFTGSDGFGHGFVLQNGVATQVDYPDTTEQATFPNDINDKGVMTGGWNAAGSTLSHAFTYNISTATFTPIKIKGATTTSAFGINNAGMIAIESDAGIFLYCPKRPSSCPGGGAGIEVPDESGITVSPGKRQVVMGVRIDNDRSVTR